MVYLKKKYKTLADYLYEKKITVKEGKKATPFCFHQVVNKQAFESLEVFTTPRSQAL